MDFVASYELVLYYSGINTLSTTLLANVVSRTTVASERQWSIRDTV